MVKENQDSSLIFTKGKYWRYRVPIKCTGEKTKQLSKESGNRFTTTFKDFSDTSRIGKYQIDNPIMDLKTEIKQPIN